MTTDTRSFAIVGGGIGGLTLAIALQQKGFHTTVYEHAPQIKPVGAGLVLAANAVKALTEIGISEDVLRAGKIINNLAIKDHQGYTLNETDAAKMSAKYGVINNFTIHRADLHRVLLSHLREGTVQLGKGCIDFWQEPDGVVLYFNDGSSVKADYVIAADGIHSVFRKKLLPGSEPRFAGYTSWRAVIDLPANLNITETLEMWGPGCRFGVVPLTNKRLYWFACINAMEKDPKMESFNVSDLATYFSNFHFPVPEILKHTKDEQLIWGDILDIVPINRFAFGNVVLMGDAAHATTPNLGQGACMAIEDAVVLANCLENYLTPREAFYQFQTKRITRTTKIVNTSRWMGKIAQLENHLLIGLRNAIIRLTPPSVAEKQLKFLYDVSFQ